MSTTSLSRIEIDALHSALDNEYRALADYDQVLRDFGAVRPFTSIREAEARHAAALITLLERNDLPVPANSWPGKVPRFAGVREACEAAIQGEIENVALYDRLKSTTRRADLLAAFELLQAASRDHHLPAFQQCAQRAGAMPRHGRGRP